MSYLMATAAIISMLTASGEDQPSGGKFTVRCMNKDSVAQYGTAGKLDLKLELTLSISQEYQLKPGDFRLAILDARLKQLDGTTVALPEEWKQKTFKKGDNKDTLTIQFPGLGDVGEGREYYLVIMLVDQFRFVKFKVRTAIQ